MSDCRLTIVDDLLRDELASRSEVLSELALEKGPVDDHF